MLLTLSSNLLIHSFNPLRWWNISDKVFTTVIIHTWHILFYLGDIAFDLTAFVLSYFINCQVLLNIYLNLTKIMFNFPSCCEHTSTHKLQKVPSVTSLYYNENVLQVVWSNPIEDSQRIIWPEKFNCWVSKWYVVAQRFYQRLISVSCGHNSEN